MPTCKECGGKGGVKCPSCDGRGTKNTGMFGTSTEECKLCNGSGKKKCGVCNGKGTV